MEDDSDISLTFPSSQNEGKANEELYKKFEESQSVEFDESRPLTFYLPSCHCLEDKKKEQETARFNMEFREKEVNEVLAPDHPALEKFQKALKEHLLKQIERLNEEIFELETVTKKKNAEKEAIGVETYETQQMVCRKQKILDEYVENVNNATAAREEIELELKEYREKYRCDTEALMRIQKEEKELRNEVETVNLLLHQTSMWEKDVESDITISKRMTEKTIKDQIQLLNEKQKQDMILYKLQSEVWKLETDLENTDMKLEVKEKEREELAQAVAEGNTTIEAIESDYRCLMHSWNSVVVAISNRDRVLHCVNQELQKYEEDHKNIICETEKVKKLTKEEMVNNEKLTAVKQRILGDIATCKNQTEDELAKQRRLEKRIMKYQSIIEATEKDIEKIDAENNAEQTALSVLDREWDKKNQTKLHWEEQIFLLLEDETTNSKASQHLALRLRQMKAQNRKLEITLALSENKNAIIQTKLESQISINAELSNLIKDLTSTKMQLEKELGDFQDKLKEYDNLIVKRQRLIDKLNNKVMEMVTIIGGKEISPAEMKIKTLEKNIEDAKERIKELQTFWMREQRNVLSLSETRQQQIANNDLLRKQILILQQKNLKLSDEIEAINKQDQKTSRNILNYHNQILMRSESLSRKKDERKGLDAHNDLAQMEFMSRLKDAELECLKLEAQIADIEEEKLIISKQLLDINREVLEWEKKLKIIVDTKNQIQLEKGAEGEIGQMKIEVHKMEVRYSQLKKAQERFMTDLEHCVYRRESIVAGNEAKEKRSKFGIEKTRFNFKRKMDDTRNQIRQIENSMKVLKDKIKKVNDEKKMCENEMKEMKEEAEEVKKVTENILNEYENVKTDKQMQFELLVMKQKKLNMYSDLARGKKPYLKYKNECALTQELVKNEEMNAKLIGVVDNLGKEFPNHMHYFNRILNTLNLPKVYAGDINSWALGVGGDCVPSWNT
ncbi:coiled-coil domain-containing protein 40 [Coccinella septempunctata]|uniref:coiled-coil domain-containing protein 40 n=1 Tax=Coccinella septempunctata TaxID=41139 RepID=UPI001D062564|nr:coiled-coil domain-containing protein 40 [Coccinella septempunctata]